MGRRSGGRERGARARSRYGSGPPATVIQDLLSVIVYFAIATALI
jgi:hypothetical protein